MGRRIFQVIYIFCALDFLGGLLWIPFGNDSPLSIFAMFGIVFIPTWILQYIIYGKIAPIYVFKKEYIKNKKIVTANIEEEHKENEEKIKNSNTVEIETSSSIDLTQKAVEHTPPLFIKIDRIDKWIGIKGDKYTNDELAEKRFSASVSLLYVISGLVILGGIVITFMADNFTFDKILDNKFILAGVIYLILTFIFHKLRMPIFLFLLALGMLSDKVYTMIAITVATKHFKFNFLSFFIMAFLIIAGIEAFRSRRLIQNPKQKTLRIIAVVIIIIFCILVVIGLFQPDLSTKKWSKETSTKIEKLYYDSFLTLRQYDGWKEYGDNMFNDIITRAAKCSILKTKEVYPTYDDFVKNYNLVGKENFSKKIQNIKDNCLTQNMPNIIWDK